MMLSENNSAEAKERDYRRHRRVYKRIIECFGLFFEMQDAESTPPTSLLILSNEAYEEVSVLQNFEVFIPDLTFTQLELLVGLFGNTGLRTSEFNLLSILRYFHSRKYK